MGSPGPNRTQLYPSPSAGLESPSKFSLQRIPIRRLEPHESHSPDEGRGGLLTQKAVFNVWYEHEREVDDISVHSSVQTIRIEKKGAYVLQVLFPYPLDESRGYTTLNYEKRLMSTSVPLLPANVETNEHLSEWQRVGQSIREKFEAEIAARDRQMRKLEAENADLRARFDQVEGRSSREISDLQRELQQKVDFYRAQVEEERALRTDLHALIRHHRNLRGASPIPIEDLTIAELKKEMGAMSNYLEVLDDTVRQKRTLEEECVREKSKQDELKAQMDMLSVSVDRAHEEKVEVMREKELLRERLEGKIEEANEALEDVLSRYSAEVDRLRFAGNPQTSDELRLVNAWMSGRNLASLTVKELRSIEQRQVQGLDRVQDELSARGVSVASRSASRARSPSPVGHAPPSPSLLVSPRAVHERDVPGRASPLRQSPSAQVRQRTPSPRRASSTRPDLTSLPIRELRNLEQGKITVLERIQMEMDERSIVPSVSVERKGAPPRSLSPARRLDLRSLTDRELRSLEERTIEGLERAQGELRMRGFEPEADLRPIVRRPSSPFRKSPQHSIEAAAAARAAADAHSRSISPLSPNRRSLRVSPTRRSPSPAEERTRSVLASRDRPVSPARASHVDDKCGVCRSGSLNCILLPCGHRACDICTKLWKDDYSWCPDCGRFVDDIYRRPVKK